MLIHPLSAQQEGGRGGLLTLSAKKLDYLYLVAILHGLREGFHTQPARFSSRTMNV